MAEGPVGNEESLGGLDEGCRYWGYLHLGLVIWGQVRNLEVPGDTWRLRRQTLGISSVDGVIDMV